MIFYRYERIMTGGDIDLHLELILWEFQLKSETKHGYWIDVHGKKKFVYKVSKSKYAYPNKLDAFLNFQKRTQRHIKMLTQSLQVAKASLLLPMPK